MSEKGCRFYGKCGKYSCFAASEEDFHYQVGENGRSDCSHPEGDFEVASAWVFCGEYRIAGNAKPGKSGQCNGSNQESNPLVSCESDSEMLPDAILDSTHLSIPVE